MWHPGECLQTVGIVSANRGQAAQDGQAQLFEINLTFYTQGHASEGA